MTAKIADFGFATRAAPFRWNGGNSPNTNSSKKDSCYTSKRIGLADASSDEERFASIPAEKKEEFQMHVGDKCGTPGFWAPELVAGTVKLSGAFKLDVFSAGVTMYRMLCNEMPFGLFEQWRVTVSKAGEIKLAKMKPNFKVISWKKEISYDAKNEVQTLYTPSLHKAQLSDDCIEFLRGMLRVRPAQRFNLDDCLNHHFMKNTGNMSKFDVGNNGKESNNNNNNNNNNNHLNDVLAVAKDENAKNADKFSLFF